MTTPDVIYAEAEARKRKEAQRQGYPTLEEQAIIGTQPFAPPIVTPDVITRETVPPPGPLPGEDAQLAREQALNEEVARATPDVITRQAIEPLPGEAAAGPTAAMTMPLEQVQAAGERMMGLAGQVRGELDRAAAERKVESLKRLGVPETEALRAAGIPIPLTMGPAPPEHAMMGPAPKGALTFEQLPKQYKQAIEQAAWAAAVELGPGKALQEWAQQQAARETTLATILQTAGLAVALPEIGVLGAGFLAEQAAESLGIVPGKPVMRALTAPAAPMAANLKRIGVPDMVADILADVIVLAAIAKASPSQVSVSDVAAVAKGLTQREAARALEVIRTKWQTAVETGVVPRGFGVEVPRVEALARGPKAAAAGEGMGIPSHLQPNARVRAADRNNLGTVVAHNPDRNETLVHFYNRETGARATVWLKDSQLSVPTAADAKALRQALKATKGELGGAEAAAKAETAGIGKLYRAMEASQTEYRGEVVSEIAAKRRAAAAATASYRAQATAENVQEMAAKAYKASEGITARTFKFSETFTDQEAKDYMVRAFTNPALRSLDARNAEKAVEQLLLERQALAPHQAEYLLKIWPDLAPVIKNVTNQAGFNLWREVIDAANLPRAIAASFDLSFPLRQGAILIARKEFYQAIGPMVRAIDKDYASASFERLMNDPIIRDELVPNGLAIANPGTGIAERMGVTVPSQEMYVSKWASKLPGIRESQWAYTTAGNEMRGNYAKNTLLAWKRIAAEGGHQYTVREVRALANWVNISTGWARLPGPLEKIVPELGTVLFAPRFWFSRLEAYPVGLYYILRNPTIRKQVMYDLGSFTALNAGLLALMKYSGIPGVDVELDPRSTDWGRIRIGNTRFDTMGGLQPVFRTAAQMIMREGKSTVTGETYPMNLGMTALRALQAKLAPGLGTLIDYMRGETYVGEEVTPSLRNLKTQAWNRVAPFWFQDFVEAIRNGGPKMGFLGVLSFFGAGVLTYETEWQKLEDARDRTSQDRFGMSIEDLRRERGTRAANAAVADDPAVLAADQAVEDRKAWYGTANKSLKSMLIPFTQEQLASDASIVDNKAWRDDRTGRQDARSAAIAGFYFANPEQFDRLQKEHEKLGDPFTIPENWTPDDIVARYLAIYTDHTNPATSKVDDKTVLYDDLDRFQSMLTPAQGQALSDNLGLNQTPREKKYSAALKTINESRIIFTLPGDKPSDKPDTGFFDLPDRLWVQAQAKDPWLQQFRDYGDLAVQATANKPNDQTVDQAMAKLGQNHPALKVYMDRSSSNNPDSYLDRYRRGNPDVDALLVYWGIRGYETVLTEAAQKWWKENIGTEPPRLRE
jgi:hypothetical protein